MTTPGTSDPTLLVIQFRLAALGSNRLLHAAFRREYVLHMPLFAGFPGFRSKLWLDDVETGVYRAGGHRFDPGWLHWISGAAFGAVEAFWKRRHPSQSLWSALSV